MIRRLAFELRYLLGDAPWDTGISPPELLAFLSEHPPARAIDLGCGTGTNAITMARAGWTVLGVDLTLAAIRAARRKAWRAGVVATFLREDVTRLRGVRGPFNLALDIGCFHSLSPTGRAAYAQRVKELLTPGGTLLLYTWIAAEGEVGPGPPSLSTLRSTFEPKLAIEDLAYGEDHHRRSAWVEMRRAAL